MRTRGPREDLTGRRFGEWTVLSLADEIGANGNYKWRCRCSCGREGDVYQVSLRQGTSRRCRGCGTTGNRNRRHDLTGKTFGRWVVLEFDHAEKLPDRTVAWWWCRCSCGTQQAVRAGVLRQAKPAQGCSWCGNGGRHPRERDVEEMGEKRGKQPL